MFSENHVFLIACLYFVFIFVTAIAAEKKLIPQKLLNHPMTFTLSLGGYAGTWAISGSLSLANSEGYLFLSYFFGTAALFIFSPLLIRPLFALTQTHRLSSLADLFSFRYNSHWAGFIIAVFTLIFVLPLMAMQFDKIAETALYLVHSQSEPLNYVDYRPWSWAFFIAILMFSLFFASVETKHQERHEGLVFSTAAQSLIKLLCFLAVGAFAVFIVFDGPSDLEAWLNANPAKLYQLNSSIISNNARTLIIIFFAAAVSFPHLFHLTFSEKPTSRSIDTATWAFPAYLLLLSLPVLPILWAAQASGVNNADYLYALGLGLINNNPWIMLLAFFCILSAASTSLVVITLSVASMCTNHLILPNLSKKTQAGIFKRLGLIKRVLIVLILSMAMALLEWTKQMPLLTNFGFAAFSAACQFLPGILAVLYWPRGNRTGLLLGLSTGFTAWFLAIVLPMLSEDAFGLMPFLMQYFRLSPDSYYTVATTACLGVNMLFFGIASFLTKSDQEERYFAQICSQDSLSLPVRQKLGVDSIEQFIIQLSFSIGQDLAAEQVKQAATDLNINMDENRPFALRLLRRQIEANLSGLFGPTVSRQIVAAQLPFSNDGPVSKDIQLIERTLESNKSSLSGLAFELDRLRRYHRYTIEHLPIGVFSLGQDYEILLWNLALEKLTHIPAENILGAHISRINHPWQEKIMQFLDTSSHYQHKIALEFDEGTRWFTFYKTFATSNKELLQSRNQTIVIEEVTETVLLENELIHNERLASIGRLAAGVAHEIGNPITGIACVAQNLKFDSDEPAIQDAAKIIIEQTERVTRIVQSLVSFAHAGNHTDRMLVQPVNLYLCADDAIHLLSLDKKNIHQLIENHIDKNHLVKGDAQRLLQVFINLFNNALDASDNQSLITLYSQKHEKTCELIVTDFGPGIPQGIQDKIFEPFFTTKEPGQGTGLGLALVYSIIEDHHGSIQLTSPLDETPGQGTRFKIQLPLFNQHET